MAGFECNVSNEDFMEVVARYDYLYNCNSKDFTDKNKNFKFLSVRIYYEAGSDVFDGLGAANVDVSAQTKGISRLEAKVPLRCSRCCFYTSSTVTAHVYFTFPPAEMRDYGWLCDRLRLHGNGRFCDRL